MFFSLNSFRKSGKEGQIERQQWDKYSQIHPLCIQDLRNSTYKDIKHCMHEKVRCLSFIGMNDKKVKLL